MGSIYICIFQKLTHYQIKVMNLGDSSQEQNEQILWVKRTADPDDFGQGATLTNQQLEECVSNYRKFYMVLDKINSEAIQRIERQDYESALDRLQDGEDILDYAIKSRKTINKALVVTILHNEACAYQGIYDLISQIHYLKALMLNISSSLRKTETMKGIEEENFLEKDSRNFEILADYVKYKKQLALYQIQYAGVLSKLYHHQSAIQCAYKSIQTLQLIFQLCFRYQVSREKHTDRKSDLKQIFLSLSKINGKLKLTSYEKYLEFVREQFSNKEKSEHLLKNKTLETVFENFSLRKIIQLCPKTLQQAQSMSGLDQECSEIGRIKTIFYLSSCFFTVGTEYRLIASKSQNGSLGSSAQFNLSELYHLYSIYLILKYVPCFTPFLFHLMTSFHNHYSTRLSCENKQNKTQRQKKDKINVSEKLGGEQFCRKKEINGHSQSSNHYFLQNEKMKEICDKILNQQILKTRIYDSMNITFKKNRTDQKQIEKKYSFETKKSKNKSLKTSLKQDQNHSIFSTKKKSRKNQNTQTQKTLKKEKRSSQKVKIKELIHNQKYKCLKQYFLEYPKQKAVRNIRGKRQIIERSRQKKLQRKKI